jgi:O-antigen/teichoic acid export membrane protein
MQWNLKTFNTNMEKPRLPARPTLGFARMMMRLPDFHHVGRQLVLLVSRGAGTVVKFALSLYIVRYLGLHDLGFYGLLTGAATAMSALFGLGLTAWIMRHLVDLPASQAIPGMFTRLTLTVLIQAVVQPPVWIVDMVLGEPIPLRWAPMIATILLLESLATEICHMLTAQRRVRLAEFLLFIRTGLWPLPVMAYGFIEPAARTIEVLMYGWVAGLVLTWLIVAAHLLPRQRWRHLQWRWVWLFEGVRESVPLYIHDVNLALSLYLDRFLISVFLGLELTGVYTFFWSIANMIHSLTIYGMLTPQIATLLNAGKRGGSEFARIVRRLQIETASWAALLTGGAIVSVIVMLPFLNRPLLGENLAVFWIIMMATLLRIGADGYSYVLYSLKRDDAIAATSVAGTAISTALNLVLVPMIGLRGAAIAFVLTAAMQFGRRYQLSRSEPACAMAARPTTAI